MVAERGPEAGAGQALAAVIVIAYSAASVIRRVTQRNRMSAAAAAGVCVHLRLQRSVSDLIRSMKVRCLCLCHSHSSSSPALWPARHGMPGFGRVRRP